MNLTEAYARLNLSVDLIPAGSKNRPGGNYPKKSITIHGTANTAKGADALMHSRYLKGAEAKARGVSWTFSVDDKRVVKHLPISERCWHCGTAKGNRESIAIEICENADADMVAAIDRAALLAAVLCVSENIALTEVVQHARWRNTKLYGPTGIKDCPRVIRHSARGWTGGWDKFIGRVGKYIVELGGYPD